MKIPDSPPDFNSLVKDFSSPERIFEIMHSAIGQQPEGRYIHWHDLQYRTPPDGFSHREWWFAIAMARQGQQTQLVVKNKHGKPFHYATPDFVLKMLHEIDRDASGRIEAPGLIANPQTRDRYLIRSLIEEAITSSQLEGAVTTHLDAKQMLREGRKPRDRSEQMIFNNYNAMQFIRQRRRDPLTPKLILELQSILTDKTLTDESAAGRWRSPGEDIKVVDERDNTVLHVPPPANEIVGRMNLLCKFANDVEAKPFMHPVVRSIVVHFMLGYDHPFVDGNGRTARALFYWSMLSQGYWMTEFLSISNILCKAPSKYARSYLHSETDNDDVTYFLVYQLEVINRSIRSLHEYLARKATEIHDSEQLIQHSSVLRDKLNHRQIVLLNDALKHPSASYRVRQHMKTNGVTYETARRDLLTLVELGLLVKSKSGRAFAFLVPNDLKQRLENV